MTFKVDMTMDNSFRRRLDLLHHHFCPPAPRPRLDMVNQCSESSRPVVIGAMVLDIHASPLSKELQPGTTTPGRVRFIRGGVARNVAECISSLGLIPFLISVVGQDMAGDLLFAHWQSLGLATDGILRCRGVSTPVVSAVFDGNGELAGAVADTHTVEEHLTPGWIGQFGDIIRSASCLMLDANLNPATLEAACKLAKGASVPIWFEPVSVSKSVRYSAIANYIDYVSPNEAELVEMAGADSKTEDDLPLNVLHYDHDKMTIHELIQHLLPHILVLLRRGVTHVVLTLGKHGVVLCSEAHNLKSSCNNRTHINSDVGHTSKKLPQDFPEDSSVGTDFQPGNHDSNTGFESLRTRNVCYVHFPALPASIVSLSGAGDCFVAGAMTSLCRQQDIHTSMAWGIAVARQAIQLELNVPTHLSQAALTVDTEVVLASATRVILI